MATNLVSGGKATQRNIPAPLIDDARRHVYEAAITREETQARFAGDLMHRVFEGSARNLVLGALTAQRAAAEDLEEIRRMFDAFEKRRKSR